MRKAVVVIALFSAILVLASTGAAIVIQANANPTWHIQVVDPEGAGGFIAFDSFDKPHIIYYIDEFFNTNRTGKNYAVWTGEKWNTEHLNSTVGNIFIMDTNNNPHVISTSNGTLNDAPLTNPVWNLKEIGIAGVAGDTITLDSGGTLHEVSADYIYSESNNSYASHLYYTTWTKTGVSVQTIGEANSTAQVAYQRLYPHSIAVDPKGNPHIIFVEQHEIALYPRVSGTPFMITNMIKYAVWTGSNWKIQTLATNTTDPSRNANLVLDSKGQPQLAYLHENRTYTSDYGSYRAKRSLEYIYFDGFAWVNQTIESESNNDYYGQPALRLDSNGNPQVFFFKVNYQPTIDYDLLYARWTGTAWDTQKIWTLTPNSYGSAGFSKIAFDSHGNPRLTYDTVMGTIRGAYRYGNLTYLAIDMSFTTSPLLVPIISGGIIAIICIAAIIYFRKRRKEAQQT